ncbi:MAG: DUF6516 family protein [Leadbetterella sp.]|nr:DUF6516 family protein [Leadbetterella sp.]
MDGEIYIYPSRHWHKVEVRKLNRVDLNFPQGIKYSFTLHSPNGARILGYDNAHIVPGDKTDMPFDHVHKGTRIVRYSYQNAAQLLTDFFNDVEVILEFEREHEYEI